MPKPDLATAQATADWPFPTSNASFEPSSEEPIGPSQDLSNEPQTVAQRVSDCAGRLRTLADRGRIRETALISALQVLLRLLDVEDLAPDRIVASADGDVSLIFFGPQELAGGSHARVATIACDGAETVLSLEDRVAGSFKALMVEEAVPSRIDAINKIREFIS